MTGARAVGPAPRFAMTSARAVGPAPMLVRRLPGGDASPRTLLVEQLRRRSDGHRGPAKQGFWFVCGFEIAGRAIFAAFGRRKIAARAVWAPSGSLERWSSTGFCGVRTPKNCRSSDFPGVRTARNCWPSKFRAGPIDRNCYVSNSRSTQELERCLAGKFRGAGPRRLPANGAAASLDWPCERGHERAAGLDAPRLGFGGAPRAQPPIASSACLSPS